MFRPFLLIALAATPAAAQDTCGPRQRVVEFLQGNYNETRQAIGLSASGAVVEWWQSQEGTWTIVITSAAGISCMVDGGDSAALLLEPAGEAM